MVALIADYLTSHNLHKLLKLELSSLHTWTSFSWAQGRYYLTQGLHNSNSNLMPGLHTSNDEERVGSESEGKSLPHLQSIFIHEMAPTISEEDPPTSAHADNRTATDSALGGFIANALEPNPSSKSSGVHRQKAHGNLLREGTCIACQAIHAR